MYESMLTRTSGILLPKSYSGFPEIEVDLNRVIRGWDDHISKMKFYEDRGDSVLIPRFYPIDIPVSDNTDEGKDILIESHIVPRNKRQEKAIKFLLDNKKGILQLEPGTGKTVIAIASICEIKKKTDRGTVPARICLGQGGKELTTFLDQFRYFF